MRQAETDETQVQAARLADTAALLHALGGGGWGETSGKTNSP